MVIVYLFIAMNRNTSAACVRTLSGPGSAALAWFLLWFTGHRRRPFFHDATRRIHPGPRRAAFAQPARAGDAGNPAARPAGRVFLSGRGRADFHRRRAWAYP